MSLGKLFQSVTALLRKEHNSGSVLQLVLTYLNIFSLVQFEEEKRSRCGTPSTPTPHGFNKPMNYIK